MLGVVAAPDARAQTGLFLDEYGASARTGALGQAFTGIANDSTAAYYNPAGLAFAAKETVLGFRYVKPRTRIRFDGPPPEFPAPVVPTPTATDTNFDPASTRVITVGISGYLLHHSIVEEWPPLDRLRWGVIMALGSPEQNTFATFSDRTEPYFFRYDTRQDLLSLAAAASVRITDWLSIGGGVIPNVDALQVSRVRVRTNAPPGDPTSGLDVATEEESVMNFAPVLGLFVKAPFAGLEDTVSLGVSYRGEIGNFFGTGETFTELGTQNPDGSFNPEAELPPGLIVNYAGYAPAQWSVGLGVRPAPGVTLGFDWVRKSYDGFRTFIDVKPDPPFSSSSAYRFGAEVELPYFAELGYLGNFQQLDLRAGYYFEETPVTTLNAAQNILDSDQHVVSGGVGLHLDLFYAARVRLDLIFQAHLLEDRSTANEGDPRRTGYTTSGKVWNLGGDVRVDW